MTYRDFVLANGQSYKCEEYSDENAAILAVRNILLSKPGNYPFHPSIGFDIKQYQFDILDDYEIDSLQREVNRIASQNVPNLSDVNIKIVKVEKDLKTYLGIVVYAISNESEITASFLMDNNGETVNVFNEIH